MTYQIITNRTTNHITIQKKPEQKYKNKTLDIYPYQHDRIYGIFHSICMLGRKQNIRNRKGDFGLIPVKKIHMKFSIAYVCSADSKTMKLHQNHEIRWGLKASF